jgi:F5/8 type C domain-containing protein/glycosyl hydrolase family 43
MKKSILMICLAICAPLLSKTQVIINPALVWSDKSGNVIQAHGGSVIKVGKIYYWYGEDRSDNKSSQKINCYSSPDLKNWTFRKVVLSSATPGMAEANLERPKVLYNEKTKQYVMWVHKENTRDYGEARALIANCTTPDGDFKFVKEFRPFNNMSRDCTLFKDDDGKTYFISTARENSDLVGYLLTDDYLDVAEQHMLIKGGRREAPVVFKKNGFYYLCTSANTGWGPNYNTVQKATNIYGPYGPQQSLYGPNTWNSYVSQTAYALNINGNFIMIADRWKGWKLADSRYIWLPVRFNKQGDILPVEWADSWSIDASTGNITVPLPATAVLNNAALNKPAEASVANEQNGNEAHCAFDNNPKTKWSASDGDWPHWLKVDLGQTYDISGSEIMWERNNGTIYKYIIESSTDNKTWKTIADKSKNTDGAQNQVDKVSSKGRYFRMKALDHEDVKGGYSWACLFEWKLFSGELNVALNKAATADSQQSGTYAAKANDGDFSSTWFTGGPKLNNWWSVDLGTSKRLTGCRIMFQDPGFYYQYKIEISSDKTNWKTVVNKTDSDVAWMPVHLFNENNVRYFRITVTGLDDGAWLGIREVEVFDSLPLPAAQKVKLTGGGKL